MTKGLLTVITWSGPHTHLSPLNFKGEFATIDILCIYTIDTSACQKSGLKTLKTELCPIQTEFRARKYGFGLHIQHCNFQKGRPPECSAGRSSATSGERLSFMKPLQFLNIIFSTYKSYNLKIFLFQISRSARCVSHLATLASLPCVTWA